MMQLDRLTLGRMAKELGFVRDTLEKVCRLADVLKFMESDELLSEAIALKGGETAYLHWGKAELAAQIGTEGNEPRSPCAEFQKVQNSDLDTNRCCLHHWSFVVSSCRLWDAATGKDTRIHATFTIFGV